jgi:hypothetical protein
VNDAAYRPRVDFTKKGLGAAPRIIRKNCQPSRPFQVHQFDYGIKLSLSLPVTIPLMGFWDGSRAQKISPSRILRYSVFRLRRMRVSQASQTIVCSYAW